MKPRALRVIIAILLSLASLVGWSQSDERAPDIRLTFTAPLVYDGLVVGDLIVRNSGVPFEGLLAVEDQRDRVASHKQLFTKGVTSLRFELAGNWSNKWTATLTTPEGTKKDTIQTNSRGTRLLGLVISPRPGVEDAERAYSSYLGNFATITPSFFPVSGEAAGGLKYVVVRGGLEKLTRPQLDNLLAWTVKGGRLVLDASGGGFDLSKKPYSQIAPVRTQVCEIGKGFIYCASNAPNLSRDLVLTSLRNDRENALDQSPSPARSTTGADVEYSNRIGPGFKLKLPSIAFIACVMFGFFLIAVPITIGILKRVRRVELAWITTPIYAIIASTLLFSGSQPLSQVKDSSEVFTQYYRFDGIGTYGATRINAYFQNAGAHKLNVDGWLAQKQNTYGSGALLGALSETQIRNDFTFGSTNREFARLVGGVKATDQLRIEARLIRAPGRRPVLKLYNPSDYEFGNAEIHRPANSSADDKFLSDLRVTDFRLETFLIIGPMVPHASSEIPIYSPALLKALEGAAPGVLSSQLVFVATLDPKQFKSPWGKSLGGSTTFRQPLVVRRGEGLSGEVPE